jgi:hypothetical protein
MKLAVRRAVIFVAAVALAGCAQLKQGWQDATEGIKPDPTAIPEGTGFSCYVANERQWSGCFRTADECNKERDQNKLSFQIDTLTFQKWGACNPASQAFCITFNMMEIQADGTGKSVPHYDCMPDDLSCSELSEGRRRESDKSRVSDCGVFK